MHVNKVLELGVVVVLRGVTVVIAELEVSVVVHEELDELEWREMYLDLASIADPVDEGGVLEEEYIRVGP